MPTGRSCGCAQLDLPADTRDAIDEVLRAVLATPEPVEQRWWNVPVRYLADRVDAAVRDRTGVQRQLDAALTAERDPRTGLHTEAFLTRWTTGLGAGLPVGLVLLRLSGIAEIRGSYGVRAELAALQAVVHCAQDLLGDVDRLVRLGRHDILGDGSVGDDFLLVLPSWSEAGVLALCDEVCVRVSQLENSCARAQVRTHARGASRAWHEVVRAGARDSPEGDPAHVLSWG